MTSEKKIQANRANAAKSTGPKTDAGKARARLNALLHGILASSMILGGEDLEMFCAFNVSMLLSLNPRNTLELQLAEQIVSVNWRLGRVRAAERELYESAASRAIFPDLEQREEEIESLKRKVVDAQEAVNRSRTHRAARQREYEELATQLNEAEQNLEVDLPESTPGGLLAEMFTDDNTALERLHRYERGLENSAHRAMNQLRQLQKQPLDETENEFVVGLLETEDQQVEEDSSPDDTGEKTKPNPTEDEAEAEDLDCEEDADSDEMTNDETGITNEVRMTKLE